MKIYYLPYALEKIVKVFSYIAVLCLDLVHFVLTPFTWMQFKAHAFMVALAGVGYVYMRFNAIQHKQAILWSILCLSIVILAVMLIKFMRKFLQRIRHSLIKLVYAPLGIYIRIHPVFCCFQNFRVKKLPNPIH